MQPIKNKIILRPEVKPRKLLLLILIYLFSQVAAPKGPRAAGCASLLYNVVVHL